MNCIVSALCINKAIIKILKLTSSLHQNSYSCFFFLIVKGNNISSDFIFFLICSEFCHTLKWNVLEFTCLPHPDLPSHLPLHPLPPGKMLMITLYAEQKKRHRFIEQSFRLYGRRRGWDVSREQHRNILLLLFVPHLPLNCLFQKKTY